MMDIKPILLILCLCSFFGMLTFICKPWPPFQVQLLRFEKNSSFFNFCTIPPCLHLKIETKENDVNNSVMRQKTTEYLENISTNFSYNKDKIAYHAYFSRSKTSVCLIMKNGHSVIKFANCLLEIKESGNETNYEAFHSLLTFKTGFASECMKILDKEPIINLNIYKKIVFIRDPLERFISGWLFACKRTKACFHCGLDFGCFMETLYLCLTTNRKYSKICTYKSFSINAPLNTSNHIYMHILPQVVYCNLLQHWHEYELIDYSTENVNNFLLSAAKPALSEKEYTTLFERLQQKTAHAASEQDEEDVEALIRSNRTLTRMFAELYYIDYKIFKFDIPQFIVDFKLHEKDN